MLIVDLGTRRIGDDGVEILLEVEGEVLVFGLQ
jgi:hypothetical protein